MYQDFPGQLDTNRRNNVDYNVTINKVNNGYIIVINENNYIAYSMDGVIRKIEEVLNDRERI